MKNEDQQGEQKPTEASTVDNMANAESQVGVCRSVGQWANKTGVTAPERNVTVTVTGTDKGIVGMHSCAGRGNC